MQLEEEKKPSQIELWQDELEENREERIERQAKIDELLEEKRILSERADEIQMLMRDELGL